MPAVGEIFLMSLQSKLFRGDPKLEAAAVSNPAHIVPGAAGPHVAKIQQALIQLDGTVIAGNELAASSYGPSTADAVLSYKKKRDIVNRSYQTQADNIVGIMTMAVLDREMSDGPAPGVAGLARSSNGTCVLLKSAGSKSSTLPNPFIVSVIISLIPQVRTAIQAADFHLTVAGPHVTNRKQTLPTGLFNAQARASLLLLDKVFDFFKFDNPRPVFDNLRTVYRNMIVALNRSFETAPLIAPTLFVPNIFDAMEKVASAYTSTGGAFLGPKELLGDLGVPANRIYLCSNLGSQPRAFLIMAAVHELAHYVSGAAIPITDPLHDFFFSPPTGTNLNAPNPTLNPKRKNLSPSQKVRDADHYAAFAFLAARPKLV
jgi:peptidoglycan hydrolase-like protein with peptidoglycan-binding domain